ncbi:hypothetical protein MMC30_009105 [Trapelia coarctata]|nr:hypothetical protein [Trapelia coarctata]
MKSKIRWMVFAVFFPEMLTAIAAEQWRSALQSLEDFHRLREQWKSGSNVPSEKLSRLQSFPWTMRHAFFADMGGILLDCPDSTPFPINSQQLLYLVENDHLDYPDLEERAIWDKNKADGFARVLTLVQVIWFFIQSVGRCIQHLALSTFELSTLAFIFCTVNTFFFWRHKPLDIATAIVLPGKSTVADILEKSSDESSRQPSRMPLDSIKPHPEPLSLIAPFWFAMTVVFGWRAERSSLPAKTFGNTDTVPPRGLRGRDITYALVFTTLYTSIHLAAWNFEFPSTTEQILWRVSSLVLLGLLIVYLLGVAFGTIFAKRLAEGLFHNNEATTLMGVVELLPRWAAVLIHGPVIAIYIVVRGYIIVEGLVNLRALPAAAYASVNWSNFIPHI